MDSKAKPKSWKPGQSGNPKGRPKDGESITAILNDYLKSVDPKSKKERRQILVEKIYALALKGDGPAIRYIFDRLDGRPGESIKLSGDKDDILKIVLEDARIQNKTTAPSE